MLARGRKGVKLTPSARGLRLVYWLPALGWMAGIAYLSHQTRPLGATASNLEAGAAHIILYAVLASTLYWPLSLDVQAPGRLATGFAFAVAVLFGITDELHQAFVPGRAASEADLALDALGALVGVSAAIFATGALRLLQTRSERGP